MKNCIVFHQHILFIFPVGTADDQQMAQLQILYKARGSKIEDLVNEMDLLKQGMGREIRILKHHLSMAKGKATSKNSHVSVSLNHRPSILGPILTFLQNWD